MFTFWALVRVDDHYEMRRAIDIHADSVVVHAGVLTRDTTWYVV